MYLQKDILGAVVTSSDAGTAENCDTLIDKWIEVLGMSAGTLDIEISNDGTNWYAQTAAIAADGWTEVPQPCTHIRINPTGATLTRVTLRARQD